MCRLVIAQQRPTGGLNRVIWDGMSATGTRAPSGIYLVRVTARIELGEQTFGLATLQLRRWGCQQKVPNTKQGRHPKAVPATASQSRFLRYSAA